MCVNNTRIIVTYCWDLIPNFLYIISSIFDKSYYIYMIYRHVTSLVCTWAAEVPAPNKKPRGNDVGFKKLDEFTNFNIESCALVVVAPSPICVTPISNIWEKRC